MKTNTGLHVIIPNKDIFQKPIINYSLTDARRIELDFLILNKGNLSSIQQALTMALDFRKDHFVHTPQVYYSNIEDPKVRMYVSVWTTSIEPNDFLQAKNEVIKTAVNVLKEQQVLQ